MQTDKRLRKSTGNYETREKLITACHQFKEAGLTTRQIAKEVGIAQGTVSRILNGDKKNYTQTPNSVSNDPETYPIGLWNLYKNWKPVNLDHLIDV